jgi:hypothetical protein
VQSNLVIFNSMGPRKTSLYPRIQDTEGKILVKYHFNISMTIVFELSVFEILKFNCIHYKTDAILTISSCKNLQRVFNEESRFDFRSLTTLQLLLHTSVSLCTHRYLYLHISVCLACLTVYTSMSVTYILVYVWHVCVHINVCTYI